MSRQNRNGIAGAHHAWRDVGGSPGLGSGCRRLSSTSTGLSNSKSGEQAMAAASATLRRNIGVLPPFNARRSHW